MPLTKLLYPENVKSNFYQNLKEIYLQTESPSIFLERKIEGDSARIVKEILISNHEISQVNWSDDDRVLVADQ